MRRMAATLTCGLALMLVGCTSSAEPRSANSTGTQQPDGVVTCPSSTSANGMSHKLLRQLGGATPAGFDPASALVPSTTPSYGVACRYRGDRSKPLPLKQSQVLSPGQLETVSTRLAQAKPQRPLCLGGPFILRPDVTLMGLSYAGGGIVWLYFGAGCAAGVSNGFFQTTDTSATSVGYMFLKRLTT